MEAINSIYDYLASTINPQSFDGSDKDSVLKQIDRGFANSCFHLRKLGIQNPENMSIYDWEIAIDNIEAELNAKKNGNKTS